MGGYATIADASQSLVQRLWNAISADPALVGLINNENLITLESAAEHVDNNDGALLSVYLYRIGENGFMKNQQPVEGVGGRLRKPPLSLDLSYLITPMLSDPFDRQVVLGKIMQALYDQPTLEGPDLFGALAGTDDVLRLSLNTVPLNEVALVWQALQIPYMLCISYLMRVALVDSSTLSDGARVVSVSRRYGALAPEPVGP